VPSRPPAASTLPADLALLAELCALDSSSGREAAILPALLPALEARGARIERQELGPGRCNLLASWGEPRVCFSTHLDTVPPFLPPRWDGDSLHGRGACDAKGQIAAQLLAIDRLRAEGRTDLAWLGLAGEETDSLGAREILAWRERFGNCRVLINGEPTGLKLATGQRGVSNLVLTCRGRAAHGGSPALGRNAILDLMAWLDRIAALPLGLDPELGPEVWNLGLVQGGTAVNIVPDRAEAWLNVRTVPGSRFQRAVAELAPADATLTVALEEPPCRFPAVPGFPRAAVPFGSDAPQLRALVPDGTVVLAGPGHIDCAHTDQERISLADFRAGVDLFVQLAQAFSGIHS
jgi:acetylornithine deacetylase